jgi:hypothetical protein
MIPLKTADIFRLLPMAKKNCVKWNEVWLVKKIVGIIDEIRVDVNNYKV